jgi:periplasmic divalent cation tolerance protein
MLKRSLTRTGVFDVFNLLVVPICRMSQSAALSSAVVGVGLESDTAPVCVYVTTPHSATEIARHVVESRVAACVNIVPGLTSVYRWEGKIEEDPEILLIIKSSRDRLDALYAAVRAVHPAQVPEFIALPISHGSHPYLTWLEENTRRNA